MDFAVFGVQGSSYITLSSPFLLPWPFIVATNDLHTEERHCERAKLDSRSAVKTLSCCRHTSELTMVKICDIDVGETGFGLMSMTPMSKISRTLASVLFALKVLDLVH